MAKIKVLLSSRPKLLSEVIRNLVEHQSDMEVVGEVIDPIEILRNSSTAVVDAVIVTPLEAHKEPKICSHLLAEYPSLKVVTVSAGGEAAYLYQSGVPRVWIELPSGEAILGALREAVE